LAVVLPRNKLDGAAAGELDVPVGGGVDLYLIVGVNAGGRVLLVGWLI
jgi:hypothetical protein